MHATINGIRVWRLDEDGPKLGSPQSVLDLIGKTYGSEVDLVVIPLARLDDDFLRLGSGLAGAFIEKLQQYRLRIAFVGDIDERVSESKPLRDFVFETNRRGQHLLVRDEAELAAKLRPL